jgi:hypothetical protein
VRRSSSCRYELPYHILRLELIETPAVQAVVVVVISFTLTSPRGGYAGYHNYNYPYDTNKSSHYIETNSEPRQNLLVPLPGLVVSNAPPNSIHLGEDISTFRVKSRAGISYNLQQGTAASPAVWMALTFEEIDPV